jgi:hypothetical protein
LKDECSHTVAFGVAYNRSHDEIKWWHMYQEAYPEPGQDAIITRILALKNISGDKTG